MVVPGMREFEGSILKVNTKGSIGGVAEGVQKAVRYTIESLEVFFRVILIVGPPGVLISCTFDKETILTGCLEMAVLQPPVMPEESKNKHSVAIVANTAFFFIPYLLSVLLRNYNDK
jgi:hypothetical protein